LWSALSPLRLSPTLWTICWRYRVKSNQHPYSALTVQIYYAIQEKNGKTEYDFQPPQQESCVNSLFPYGGYSPCWYEREHPQKEIRI
jgi:hypothetical protein